MSYFDHVMADQPINYFRMDEAGGPFHDYGSQANDMIQTGAPGLHRPALILDPDFAIEFDVSGDLDGMHHIRPVQTGPLNIAIEAWVKPTGVGRSVTGFGNAAGIWDHRDPVDAINGQGFAIKNGTDLYYTLSSWIFGAGLEAGYTNVATNVISIGSTYHVVLKYLAGPNFAGDGNPLAGGGEAMFYVNGVRVLHDTGLASFRPFIDTWPTWTGHAFSVAIGNIPDNIFGDSMVGFSSQAILDEVALYGTNTIGGDPLPADRITDHHTIGTLGGNLYLKSLAASESPTAFFIHSPRWYIGPFKVVSGANFRAVSRALNNMLTKNRDVN